MVNQDWHVQPRGRACTATGREFHEGEPVYSALFWRNGQYEREDYSEEGWNSRNDNIRPLSHWKDGYEPPPPTPPEPLKKDDAEGWLRALLAENDPAKRNTRYILALMLERKRILRPIDTQRREPDGAKILVYEHLPTADTWIIEDPGLHLDQLDAVQEEVATLLGAGAGLPAAPKPEPTATPLADEAQTPP
jgi:hypothetical protein